MKSTIWMLLLAVLAVVGVGTTGIETGGLPVLLRVADGQTLISGDGTGFEAALVVSTPGRCNGDPDGGFINCDGIAVSIGGDLISDHWLVGSVKAFRIDHPLDPANRFLMHTCIESDRMRNLYDGVATCDGSGAAVVELPAWFEALNGDYRYQLTCIGGSADVYIATEISGGRFTIGGGRAGLRVSWQVTGVRRDAFARQYRVPVEPAKAEGQRGRYLHPECFGEPEEKRISHGAR